MQLLKKIPFFLVLLVVFFCLHGSVENYGYLNAVEVMEVGGIAILCIAVFLAITWLFTRDLLFASLVCFFIALWYLFFGVIHDVIKATSFLQFLQSYTVLLPALLVFNILVIWWIKRIRKQHKKIALYLNLLFLLFCITDAVLITIKYFNYKDAALTPAVNFNTAAVKQKPNVYFLLFDEYAGYKSLQDSFGFKNDSFYHFLQQQQFKELPGFANYDFTPFSMSSILNMQYVPENYQKHKLTQPDIQQRFGEIRNARVFSIFKELGYTIENNSIFDIKGNPALYRYNGLFPTHAGLLTNKIFHNRAFKNIGWWFITGKFKMTFLQDYFFYRKDAYNLEVEKAVQKSMKAKQPQPKFCYAHFFLPHGQFYRDSAGNFNTPEQINDLKYLADKSLYLSYLKYTNNIIANLVKELNSNDPGAIVIIMSDHGFYDYDNPGDYDPYNFDNICFLRFPAGMQQEGKTPGSNVNFFRYFFNNGFGQNFPFVKDSTIFVIEDPDVLR